MNKDYYNILDIEKSASQDEIKKAFRKKAHTYHPDKKDGDEAKFKEANEAYQVLSNEQKRQQYDQFGSAGSGAGGFGGQGGQGFGGFDFSGFQQGGAGGQQFNFEDLDDIMGSFFGGGFQRKRRGRDIQLSLRISFRESIYGVDKTVSIPDLKDGQDNNSNKQVQVTIPAGIENGQRLKVPGYGEQLSEGQAGNLLLQMIVEPHENFKREGRHITMALDVKLTDAINGAKYEIKDLDDKKLKVKIPAGLEVGQILRVKGKGVQGGTFNKGDLYIRTNIIIPKAGALSKDAKKAIEILEKEGF